MFFRHDILRGILPLAAVVSIVGGPSLSTSFAEQCARQAEEESRLESGQTPADQPQSEPSDTDAGEIIASSIAAKAAKPTRANAPDIKHASGLLRVVDTRNAHCRTSNSAPGTSPNTNLHRPAYLAQAPPVIPPHGV